MNRFIGIILLTLIILGIEQNLQAGSYYVNNSVGSSGDGSSWASAWKNFSDINWGAIQPGDILYISGGSDSLIYTETMFIPTSVSGTYSAPVIITKGTQAGHNGKVVLDGNGTRDNGIVINYNNFVTIRGLKLKNFIGTGAVKIDHADGVLVEANEFVVSGHGAVFIQRSQNSVIKANDIATVANTALQTDGIYSQLNQGNIYDGNKIIINNQNIDPHCDGIQMFKDESITIRNNYIEQNNTKPYNAQGIFITNSTGTFEVYNNVIYGPNTENALLTLAHFGEGNAILHAYHNTLYGGGWGTLHLKESPNSVVKDNILVNFKPNGWVFKLSGGISNPTNINYNDYFTPNSNIVATYDDVGKNWSDWKGYGFENNGVSADPVVRNAANRDFKLNDSSPLIDAGSPGCGISLDKDGAARPKGSACDPGAYEYLVSDPPPPPGNNSAYYIDNAVSATGNGSSWAEAWKNFSDINWSVVDPGDVIYISGGSVSKTYTGTMNVSGVNGTASDPVIITRGSDAGHDGTVIFDGQYSTANGISMDNVNYVTVKKLSLRNYTGDGTIRINYGTAAVVDSCEIDVAGHGGVFIQNSTASVIKNNKITTPSNLAAQTDGIYSQLNSGNVYERNEIVISNQAAEEHCDGIQMYVDTDITVRGNYIEQRNNKTSNAQGIYATDVSGTFNVYNNVVYGPNTDNPLLTVAIISQGNGVLVAEHNTLVGGGWGTLQIQNSPNSIVKSNILMNEKTGGWVFRLSGGISNPANIDYNAYYTPNSNIVATSDNVSKSWTEWKVFGFANNGLYVDPRLADINSQDFTLHKRSFLINAGSSACNIAYDMNGVARPQGDVCDIGAYEATYTKRPKSPKHFRLLRAGGN